MTCFVTVGTTSFERLILSLNDEELRKTLKSKFHIDKVRIQFGRGENEPIESTSSGISISSFRRAPTLYEEMNNASLIISHAGAGSVVEALRLGKKLIVVVNDELMDNHQIELAEALKQGGYLEYASSPESLHDLLKSVTLDNLKPYPTRNASGFVEMMDEELGF